ncbi:hypothetical protein WNZ14_22020 [Hoeflea sp. AS60]|uniref:hypothetical protein n=1 Tax=Hoeflea sp. AS60 TaxID=3135780 RepID=UPI0031816A3C
MGKATRTKWTDELDARLLSLWEANCTVKDITVELGKSEQSVQTRASRRGFGKRNARDVIGVMSDGTVYWSEAEIDLLMDMRIKGASHKEMAAHFGRTKNAIHALFGKIEREGRPTVSPKKMIPCMCCGVQFGSEGWHNKQCEPCFRYNTSIDV